MGACPVGDWPKRYFLGLNCHMSGWDDGHAVGSSTASRPPVGPGFIRRADLLAELRQVSAVPLVLVVGGAGFGKTTVVSQWLKEDERTVAWLTASVEHDDPVVLLADLVRVLDEFEPLEPHAKHRLSAVTIDFGSVLVPRMEEAVSARGRPVVLVIDDTHRLRRRTAWHLIEGLVNSVPSGSQVVLTPGGNPFVLVVDASRPPCASCRDRATRVWTELRPGRCSTSPACRSLKKSSTGCGSEPRGGRSRSYLATLALREARLEDRIETAERFAGDDRLVVQYVHEELLEVLPARMRTFLLRGSNSSTS